MPTDQYVTAKETGMAPATLIAMSKRGLVDVCETSPKTYRRINSAAAKVYYMCEKYKNMYEDYFGLYEENESIGMLCSINNSTVCDCWGKPYTLSECKIIRFGQKFYSLTTGKEISYDNSNSSKNITKTIKT